MAVNRQANQNLITAVKAKDIEAVKRALRQGADVNSTQEEKSKSYYGLTALMIAASEGAMNAAQLLIKSDADVNIADSNQWTALAYASYYGYVEIAKQLIVAGADKEARDDSDCTPLMCATGNGKIQTVQLLIEAGADINAYSKDFGFTPLSFAARGGYTDIVKLLLDSGADVNAQYAQYVAPRQYCLRRGDSTALMMAAFFCHVDTIRLLIERGANVNARNQFTGETAFMRACDNGVYCVRPKRVTYGDRSAEAARLILEAGADINAQDIDGMTALMHACRNGQINIVRFLLQSGADITIKDNDGDDAAAIASALRYEKIVDLLGATNDERR